ncbi:hypothetical protein F9C07_11635 [Aspergillus flavus]|uniref:Uncharacterized protein n=1 Tax=Aspergillus flavus (strain ATCC 200026 / FGSC A1120 / IAM 13836 / NRRL 3357 / JCM 12722 / SRRC 167) TaxID=332952 RepID=A0A7U2N346_ASPFN|nr:hypothetical protein F9C07_11635 [Aspergillus flavus]
MYVGVQMECEILAEPGVEVGILWASLVDINETPLWGAGNERGPCLCLIHVTSNA